jgi:hypothetical protein
MTAETATTSDTMDALAALYDARLADQEAAPTAVFTLTEVVSDDRPVLIQCCIR